ncbi:MAG: helix-turn-helix transcriptional regulator [Heliobacteriaceae bacterium]|jgi:DNA-binding XRE family transcriptional regulator|nr:helix-turn-helix transcriptional regulator [Heliobacteriaceae bacterium]
MARDICKVFAINMFYKRKDLGLTQEDIAQAVGLSVSAISAYENSKICPDLRTAEKIALALGFRLPDMLK